MTGDPANRRGLVIVYTGDGKGKTTAALGLALRAIGHGQRVVVIQFLKRRRGGEHSAAERLAPELEIRPLGAGFVRGEWTAEDRRAAREAWAAAEKALLGGQHDLVILDEITYAIRPDVIPADEVLELLRRRPGRVHVVLTGREAPQALIDEADLVTEMQCLKHPYEEGIKAQAGIEF